MALVPDYPPAAFVWRRVRRRVVRADGPERVFGEWWRADDERSAMRDYYRLEAADGSRYWVFRDGPAVEGVNGHRSLRDCGLPKFPTLAGWRLLVISRCRDRLWSFLVGDCGVVAPVAVR
jgi:hypothetical protein